jgi:hypothetical protein
VCLKFGIRQNPPQMVLGYPPCSKTSSGRASPIPRWRGRAEHEHDLWQGATSYQVKLRNGGVWFGSQKLWERPRKRGIATKQRVNIHSAKIFFFFKDLKIPIERQLRDYIPCNPYFWQTSSIKILAKTWLWFSIFYFSIVYFTWIGETDVWYLIH